MTDRFHDISPPIWMFHGDDRRHHLHETSTMTATGGEFLRYLGRGTDSKNRRALRLVQINYLIINYLIINYLIILNSLQLLSVCLIKMSIK